MSSVQSRHISLDELRTRLAKADDAVMLVEPRILRRVIKQDRRIAGLGLHVPHHKCYTVSSDRLLMIVDRSELDLSPSADLPATVILLETPTEGEDLDEISADTALYNYWRLLFHARVHLTLDNLVAEGRLNEQVLDRRIREIGFTEFAEVQSVLQREDLLLPPRTNRETYIEFAAVFLELRYFTSEDLSWYFPTLRDHSRVEAILEQDVRHGELFATTRLEGANLQVIRVEEDVDGTGSMGEESPGTDAVRPSPPQYWRRLAKATRAGALGNQVKAAILRHLAARIALVDRVAETRAAARGELEHLVERLQGVLGFQYYESEQLVTALESMLPRSSKGFWSPEARFLYDLQKICVEHERGVFTLEVVEWIKSLGKSPLRRPLPLLREVLIAKHLRTAARRLSSVRVSEVYRESLQKLLQSAEARVEQEMRNRVRPRIVAVLDDVGLIPQNVPERVARRKLVEELLDRIADRGFIHMGDLRDELSKNNLKLQDVSFRELLHGDPLIRANSRLAKELDGVYRSAPVYLRLPQRLSSTAFGTRFGRNLTSYVALPYGGAYLAIEFLRHVFLSLTKGGKNANASASVPANTAVDPLAADQLADMVASAPAAQQVADQVAEPLASRAMWLGLWVALVGTFVLMMIHNADFRRQVWELAVAAFRLLRRVLIDLPAELLRSPWVQRILQSQSYRVVRNYLLKPAVYSALLLFPPYVAGRVFNWPGLLNIFLAINLFLNSPIGRYADEWLTDVFVRGLRELQAKVLAAAVRLVIDIFQQILEALERVLYSVDEWLRFRRGEPRFFLIFKALLSFAWSLVTYVIRFCVTLLIEPQVNPLKHFPVVTVSHKILLPMLSTLGGYLTTFLPASQAYPLATVIIFILPGIPGFLVWELKANWQLYVANRQKKLGTTAVGSHGESLVRLLRPGFHSGTMPKLFAKLRRAGNIARERNDTTAVLKQIVNWNHCELSVQRFVQREFIDLLSESRGWNGATIRVARARLATNRVEVDLVWAPKPSANLESSTSDSTPGDGDGTSTPIFRIVFEDQDGWLVSQIRSAEWISHLNAVQRDVLAVALLGFYKLAGVDIVNEHVVTNFSRTDVQVDVRNNVLRLISKSDAEPQVTYPLRGENPWVAPSATLSLGRWQALERREFLFERTVIRWEDWVRFWEEDQAAQVRNEWLPTDRVLSGFAIPHAARWSAQQLPIQ